MSRKPASKAAERSAVEFSSGLLRAAHREIPCEDFTTEDALC
jgi:hypothetical protein